MPILKLKTCNNCSEEYKPTGPAAKYCDTCKVPITKAKRQIIDKNYQIRKGRKVGVGKGGANKKGAEDPQFKTGIRFFQKYRRIMRQEVRYCQRCKEDLLNATQGKWCVHHKDHNRANNKIENFELLCKKCHQLEHECWKNLPN